MLRCTGLKLSSEPLADSISHFSLLESQLIEDIGSVIRKIVHVFGFFLHVNLVTKPISALAEQVLYLDNAIRHAVTSSCDFKLCQCSLMSVNYKLIHSCSNY